MFILDDAYRRLDAAQSFKEVFTVCEFINEGKHQLSRMDEHAFYFTAAIRLIQLSAPSAAAMGDRLDDLYHGSEARWQSEI